MVARGGARDPGGHRLPGHRASTRWRRSRQRGIGAAGTRRPGHRSSRGRPSSCVHRPRRSTPDGRACPRCARVRSASSSLVVYETSFVRLAGPDPRQAAAAASGSPSCSTGSSPTRRRRPCGALVPASALSLPACWHRDSDLLVLAAVAVAASSGRACIDDPPVGTSSSAPATTQAFARRPRAAVRIAGSASHASCAWSAPSCVVPPLASCRRR